MKWVNVVYGVMFFIASVAYALILNFFVDLSLQLNSFLQIFGVSVLLMIGTIIMTNTYLEGLSHDYYEYVALTYIIMGILFLFITKSSYVFTSICGVIAIYYVVKTLKHKR